MENKSRRRFKLINRCMPPSQLVNLHKPNQSCLSSDVPLQRVFVFSRSPYMCTILTTPENRHRRQTGVLSARHGKQHSLILVDLDKWAAMGENSHFDSIGGICSRTRSSGES